MSGYTKLVIQSQNGLIYNLMPTNTQISDWAINSEFDSSDKKVRHNYMKKMLREWKEDCREMLAKPDKLSKGILKDCLNSAPCCYGICFISFRHKILMNIQMGSSVNLAVEGMVFPEAEINKLWSFKDMDKGSFFIHIRHVNWTVIEANQLKGQTKKMAQSIMESCGVNFTAQENKIWMKY